MSAKQAATLLSSRRFAPMFGAQLFGAFNDQFLKMALITLVTWGGMTLPGISSKVLVPIAGAIFTLPFFLFSAMAGQVSDKYDKALVLLRVKQAEIFIMMLAAVGLLLGNVYLLLLTIAMMGAQSAFFSPTRNAVLPQWLTDKELITGNALMNGFISVAILLGQAFGVFLIVTKGGPMIVASILIVLAILGWLSIRLAPPAPSSSPEIKIDKWILPEIGRTMMFAVKDKPVFLPMLGTAWYYWLSAGVLIFMPAFIRDPLYYSQGVLINVMVLFTIGALCGAIACLLLSKNKDGVLLSAVGAFGIGIFALDLFFMAKNPVGLAFADYIPETENAKAVLGSFADFLGAAKAKHFMASLFGASFCASLYVIPLNALAQRRANPKHRARLLAAGALLLNAATTLSQLLIAVIGIFLLPQSAPLLIIGVLSLCIALYVFYRAGILKQKAI